MYSIYTKIIHPVDGRSLYIHTGDDNHESYEVGDSVNWSVCTTHAGEGTLLNGVYYGYSEVDSDAWVVIKNHKIHAVVEIDNDEDYQEENLWLEYEIKNPPKSLWPLDLWKKKEDDFKKSKERTRRIKLELDKEYDGVEPSLEKTAEQMAYPVLRDTNFTETIKKVFKITPIDEDK